MYELMFKPLNHLENAKDLVDGLLADHKDLLPGELASRLDTYRRDLQAAIEDGRTRLAGPTG